MRLFGLILLGTLLIADEVGPPLALRYQWARLVSRNYALRAELKEVAEQMTAVQQQMDNSCKQEGKGLKYNAQKDEHECVAVPADTEKK